MGKMEGQVRVGNTKLGLTLAATPFFFAGVFLVTPAGLLETAVDSAAGFLTVLGLVVRLMAGAVSTVSKTRGLELPVAERVPSRAIATCDIGVLFED